VGGGWRATAPQLAAARRKTVPTRRHHDELETRCPNDRRCLAGAIVIRRSRDVVIRSGRARTFRTLARAISSPRGDTQQDAGTAGTDKRVKIEINETNASADDDALDLLKAFAVDKGRTFSSSA
jgi:hypothetical protein